MDSSLTRVERGREIKYEPMKAAVRAAGVTGEWCDPYRTQDSHGISSASETQGEIDSPHSLYHLL